MKFGSIDYDEQDRKKEKANAAPPPAPRLTPPGYGPGGGSGRSEYSQAEVAEQTQAYPQTLPGQGKDRQRENGASDHDRQQAVASKEAAEAKPQAAQQAQKPTLSPSHQKLNERIRAHKADEGKTSQHVAMNERIRAAKNGPNGDLKAGAAQSRENCAARAEQQQATGQEQKKGRHQ